MKALLGTAAISGMILFIIVGATTFAQILTFSGRHQRPGGRDPAAPSSAPVVVLGAMMLILLVLGCFIDQVSMMLITLPVLHAAGRSIYGFDPVWFGVLFLICMQLGLLTPPFGMLLFTMKSVAPKEITMEQVCARGHAVRDLRPADAGGGDAVPAGGHLAAADAVRELRCNHGTIIQGRSRAAQARRRRDIPRRGHPRRDQGAAAVGRVLRRRLPGRAGVAHDGRAERRARHRSTSWASTSRPTRPKPARRRCSAPRSTIRCAARSTWKSTVGTNVASDALSNLASAGVKGGALIVIGEDYGEGASIIQERTHAFAMKSQIWLLDPRPNLPTIVQHGREGLRAVRGIEHAGVPRAAHPRLPRARQLRGARTTAAARLAQARCWKTPTSTSAASACRRRPTRRKSTRSRCAGRPR